MKVYLVYSADRDGGLDFYGCFSTQEKAEAFVDNYPSQIMRMLFETKEFTIDEDSTS